MRRNGRHIGYVAGAVLGLLVLALGIVVSHRGGNADVGVKGPAPVAATEGAAPRTNAELAGMGAAPTPRASRSASAIKKPPRASCTVTVGDVDELVDAVGRLSAGRTVCLAPGTYRLRDRLRLPAERSGASDNPAVITARDGPGTVTIDGNGQEEAFHVTGARYVVISDLKITNAAYHAVKIDAPSSDITLRGNEMFDNFRAGEPNAQYSAVKGCCLTQRVTIEHNEIYYSAPAIGNNHQGIDCNSCRQWVVRNNRVHGIRSQEYAAAVQFKSGSSDTVIDGNVIYDSFTGISYGGFGNPAWANETFEHVRGVVRNNVIYGCDDAGITVINTRDGKVYNNTLFDNGFTPDVRVAAVNLRYVNNILDRPLNLRDGTSADRSNNVVLRSAADPSLFLDAAKRNFRPAPNASSVIGEGADLGADVPHDHDGRSRAGRPYDIGAYRS